MASTGQKRIRNSLVERNSSIELLRLLLMFMIVVGHCIIHGLGLYGISPNSDTIMLIRPNDIMMTMIIYNFCTCAVNCFVFISGYYKIKLERHKLIGLLFTLLFYQIIFNVIPAVNGDISELLRSVLFLSHSPYWFIIDYMFLMAFAPLLNILFDKMSRRYSTIVLISMLIASCYFGFLWSHPINTNGYTLFQFLLMYSIGRYIRITNFNIKINLAASTYVSTSICLGLIMYICYCYDIDWFVWRTCYYNNPLVMANGICIFFIFKSINLDSKIVNALAKSAVAIYLVQSSNWISRLMYAYIAESYKNTSISGGVLC